MVIIMLCGMSGSLMVAQGVWAGYYPFLTGAILGVYWCYQKKAWPLMALDIFYVGANSLGIWNHIINGG